MLTVGACGLAVAMPATVDRWFTGTGTSIVLLFLGMGLSGLALLVARRGRSAEHGSSALTFTRRAAMRVATALLASVSTVILLAGPGVLSHVS